MINLRTLASLAKAKPASEAAKSPLTEKLDAERLSRRAALRRIGMVSGMAVLGTLTIDDLARVSAKKLQQNELTRGIGDSLAKDFRNAGVAFADTVGTSPSQHCNDNAVSWGNTCRQSCSVQYPLGTPQYLACVSQCDIDSNNRKAKCLADCITRAQRWKAACIGLCNLQHTPGTPSYTTCVDACNSGYTTRINNCV